MYKAIINSLIRITNILLPCWFNNYCYFPMESVSHDFIDPDYVMECLIDLESLFDVEVLKNDICGFTAINLYYDPYKSNMGQIENLIEMNRMDLERLLCIECVIQKIKIGYPNFEYRINNNRYFTHEKYGIQILRNSIMHEYDV